MFYLKTCRFNGVKPRLFEHRFREGIFGIDPPEVRFSIAPCHHQYCQCCHPSHLRQQYPNNTQLQQRTSIPFTTPHRHRFVNQYEAILNCPAVRTSIELYSFPYEFCVSDVSNKKLCLCFNLSLWTIRFCWPIKLIFC